MNLLAFVTSNSKRIKLHHENLKTTHLLFLRTRDQKIQILKLKIE